MFNPTVRNNSCIAQKFKNKLFVHLYHVCMKYYKHLNDCEEIYKQLRASRILYITEVLNLIRYVIYLYLYVYKTFYEL